LIVVAKKANAIIIHRRGEARRYFTRDPAERSGKMKRVANVRSVG